MALHINSQMIDGLEWVCSWWVHIWTKFALPFIKIGWQSSQSLEYVCFFHENEPEVLSSIATERLSNLCFQFFSGRYTIKVPFSVVQQLPYPSCHWTENHIDPYLHHWCACLLSSLLGPRNRMQSPGHYQLGSPGILCSLWLFQPDEVVLHEPNIYIETENKRKLK